LPQIQARTLSAVRDALEVAWTGQGDALASQRRRLQGELAALRTVHADALADRGGASDTSDARWPVTVAIEELAVLGLSWPGHRRPPGAEDARSFLRDIDELADSLTGGRRRSGSVQQLPEQPRTSAAAAALAAAIEDLHRT
jgi:hypothetical protein